MKNKLGLTEYRYNDIEKKLVNVKLNLLNDAFTFNTDIFSIDYLIRLHNFLFRDIVEEEICGMRTINKIELNYLNQVLLQLKGLINIIPKDINRILAVFNQLSNLQLFVVGNKRTLIGYLKVINEKFKLNINFNVNDGIDNYYDFSNLTYNDTTVNQKTLTK